MKRPARYFRAGVGAVIADRRRQILALERSDYRGAWQLPQGGLEKDESPFEGVYREIEEETGLLARDLELISQYPELLVYELPPTAQTKKSGLGQVQYWYFFNFKGARHRTLTPPRGEFSAARWVSFDRIVDDVATFRQPIYRKLLAHFRTLGR
jgi:putative (di)nucleoside polyphosphate hydrolase